MHMSIRETAKRKESDYNSTMIVRTFLDNAVVKVLQIAGREREPGPRQSLPASKQAKQRHEAQIQATVLQCMLAKICQHGAYKIVFTDLHTYTKKY